MRKNTPFDYNSAIKIVRRIVRNVIVNNLRKNFTPRSGIYISDINKSVIEFRLLDVDYNQAMRKKMELVEALEELAECRLPEHHYSECSNEILQYGYSE